jgi:hypothetical protein
MLTNAEQLARIIHTQEVTGSSPVAPIPVILTFKIAT